VRWPKYIKLQRQRRVLLKRIKVPGVINQFNRTLDKHNAAALLNFLEKYAPETKHEKKARLLGQVKGEEAGKKPKFIKAGLKHVTTLIESRRAKLVIIAHDVDPIEVVLWLPTLCRKKGVPYVIIKGKARLGKIVHKKTATCLAVTEVDQKDIKDLGNFIEKGNENFNNRLTENMKAVGGGVMGHKHNAKKSKEEKRRQKEKKVKSKD
jgi:large subunit ribosomal protein L7Ae